jgi:GH24 family phage-related lysozyme (muramidase)
MWSARSSIYIKPTSDPGQSGGHDLGDYIVQFNTARLGSISDAESTTLQEIAAFTEDTESFRTSFYVPSGGSGATIGHGIDFGALDLSDGAYSALLANVTLPAGSHSIAWWASTLASLGGQFGGKAIVLMNTVNNETTSSERIAVFGIIEQTIYTDRLVAVENNWNSNLAVGGEKFFNLPAQEQAVLFDITFQKGNNWLTTSGQGLLNDMQAGLWSKAIAYINQSSSLSVVSQSRKNTWTDLIKSLAAAN